MANKTRRDQISLHSQTDQQSQLRLLAPALMSALLNNLPVAARSADITEQTVTANTTGPLGVAAANTGFAGTVLAVPATTGGAPGAKTIVTGAPAAGQVQVVYDANGIPTLNFNAADAITSCNIVMNQVPANFKNILLQEPGM
jgi:hypothetical protein